MPNPIAELIGFTYAHLQNGIDHVVDWGLQRMREVGKNDVQTQKKEPSSKAVKAAKGTLRFLGETGDAYFRTYEKLKSKSGKGA